MGELTARGSHALERCAEARVTEGNDDLIALDALDHQLAWELDVRELSVYRQGGDRPGELEARIPLAAQ